MTENISPAKQQEKPVQLLFKYSTSCFSVPTKIVKILYKWKHKQD